MIREETFDMLGLRNQACKFTVKGDKMGLFDILEDEVDVFIEIVSINLHNY